MLATLSSLRHAQRLFGLADHCPVYAAYTTLLVVSSGCLAQAMIGDNELVYDSKRMLGATYDDLAAVRFGDRQSDISRWPFSVQRSRSNRDLPVITGADRPAARTRAACARPDVARPSRALC